VICEVANVFIPSSDRLRQVGVWSMMAALSISPAKCPYNKQKARYIVAGFLFVRMADYILLQSSAALRQFAAHFLLASFSHFSHSAAHFSQVFAHAAQIFFTSLLFSFIALIAFSQAVTQSLPALVQVAFESLEQDFSHSLHDAIHSSHAAIQSLYLSIPIAVFIEFFLDSLVIVVAIVINPIAANIKIIFFILLMFKV
jgi:hypothetical protein